MKEKTNVVIYARYSCNRQTKASIEGQLQVCHKYCEDNGYTVLDEYIDEELSGTTDRRPEFLRMVEDSEKEHFQYVIVYQLDRFSRNRHDSAIYKNKLKQHGVRVLSVKENISEDASGILLESVIEGLAEYYSVELGQKIRRGMDLKASKQLFVGGNCGLGYKINKNKEFQIDPDTAPIVKYVFEEYVNGATVTEITDYLNARGYKTSIGNEFNKNSLRTMLQSKRYIGVYTYKGKETEGAIPAIVSVELYEKVAEILGKNRKAPARAKAKEEYLLTTKLFCGYCKEMMTGYSGTSKMNKTYNYYICNGKKKKVCDRKMIGKKYIEDLVVKVCQKLLTSENIKQISKAIIAEGEKSEKSSAMQCLKTQLAENERKHKNLLEAIEDCDDRVLRQSFFSKVLKIEEEHNLIKRDIAHEQKVQARVTMPQIKFFLKALKGGDINDSKYKKLLINVFVNAVYLYDDKVTFIFNSGNIPITISDVLLSEIEGFGIMEEIMFLERPGPYES